MTQNEHIHLLCGNVNFFLIGCLDQKLCSLKILGTLDSCCHFLPNSSSTSKIFHVWNKYGIIYKSKKTKTISAKIYESCQRSLKKTYFCLTTNAIILKVVLSKF